MEQLQEGSYTYRVLITVPSMDILKHSQSHSRIFLQRLSDAWQAPVTQYVGKIFLQFLADDFPSEKLQAIAGRGAASLS